MGVVRVVGLTVVGDALNESVDIQYTRDRRLGGCMRSVGRGIYEVGRLEKATEWIVLVTRVLSDTRHRVWVQHLKEERTESANQHRGKIAVHNSRYAKDVTVGLAGIIAASGGIPRESGRTTDREVGPSTQARRRFMKQSDNQGVLLRALALTLR